MAATRVPILHPTLTLSGEIEATTFCAVSTGGAVAISSDRGCDARVWDITNGGGACKSILQGHHDMVLQCALSADGTIAATSGEDSTSRVWDVASGRQMFALHKPGYLAAGCALSADGTKVVTTFHKLSWESGLVFVTDWRTGETVTSIQLSCAALECSVSADAKIIAFAVAEPGEGPRGVQVRGESGQLIRTITCEDECSVSVSGDGSCIAVADAGCLLVHETQGDSVPTAMYGYHPDNPQSPFCAISANSAYIVATHTGHRHSVWDTATGSIIAILDGHSGSTNGCAISDGLRVVTCSNDESVRIWSLSGQLPI